MFDTLRDAIEELHIPLDGDALVAAIKLHERFGAQISDAVGAFDAADLWDLDAATSMVAWLRDRARMSRPAAAHLALQARRLRQLPVTNQAYADGTLSASQVDAVTTNVRNRRLGLFAEHEAGLVPKLAPMSVDETADTMRRWREHADDVDGTEPDPEPQRSLYLSETLDGRHILNGSYDSDNGQIVATALRVAMPALDTEDLRSPATKRADALVDICRFFLDNQQGCDGGRQRPHLTVVATLDNLTNGHGGEYVEGGRINPTALHALLCDCTIGRLIVDGANILDQGALRRLVSKAKRRAVVIRDRHCRAPGCDRPASWCEAHHVIAYPGGKTVVTNLVLLCSRHHHRFHKPGWSTTMTPDGVFSVIDPNGQTRTTQPPGLGRGTLAA